MAMRAFLLVLCLCPLLEATSRMGIVEEKRNPPPEINTFVVPHSHQDVGWQDTPEGYFDSKVKAIYDTIVEELTKDASRRFISVEMWFVERWWQTATPLQQEQFRLLVEKGQIEFVNGGWVMHDGAITTYEADINQMTLGHRFIWENFGQRPQIGWHIDPFGASALTPTHMAMMGFNVFVMSRIPWAVQQKMEQDQTLQFIWRGSRSLGANESMFTMDLGEFGYCSPWVMDWDQPLTPPVLNLTVLSFALDFLSVVEKRWSWGKTPLTLLPWGCDFEFFNATAMFTNMDKLLAFMDHTPEFDCQAHYSTLSEYFAALNALNQTWSVRGPVDLFPYVTKSNVWSGFFTSRPRLKGFARHCQDVLATAEKLFTWSYQTAASHWTAKLNAASNALESLRSAVGVVQHHDAITGTEGHDFVVDDYMEKMSQGRMEALSTAATAVESLIQLPDGPIPDISYEPTALLSLAADQYVAVVVSQAVAWKTMTVVQVPAPLSGTYVEILDGSGMIKNSQRIQCDPIDSQEPSTPTECIAFPVVLPPMGFATYFVRGLPKPPAKSSRLPPIVMMPHTDAPDFAISNKDLTLTFSGSTGLLQSVVVQSLNQTLDLSLDAWQYASPGSDAYNFKPSGPATKIGTGVVQIVIHRGDVLDEVCQTFADNYKQIIRLYHQVNTERIEVIPVIGPVPMDTDAVLRVTTPMATSGVFYTDNNGLEMQQRQYNASLEHPIAANYYPFTAMSYLKETHSAYQMSVVGDRAHGVTSQQEGQMELMIHRRNQGKLSNDTDIVAPRLWLHIGTPQDDTRWRHTSVVRMQYLPVLFYTTQVSVPPSEYQKQFALTKQALTAPLPWSLHWMSFDTPATSANDREALIRLVHLYEVDEDPVYSQPFTVDLRSSIAGWAPGTCEERSLTTMWPLKDMHRWVWRTEDETPMKDMKDDTTPDSAEQDECTVTLNPMNIKTLLCGGMPWDVTVSSILSGRGTMNGAINCTRGLFVNGFWARWAKIGFHSGVFSKDLRWPTM